MSNLVPVDNDITHIPCPLCGGEGRGGFGEVELDPDRDCVVDEYGNLYWKDEPRV